MRTDPTIEQIAELLQQRPFYLHIFGLGKDRRYRSKPKDVPTLTVTSLGKHQFTVTRDNDGESIKPPGRYPINDWSAIGQKWGSTFWRRPVKEPPPDYSIDDLHSEEMLLIHGHKRR